MHNTVTEFVLISYPFIGESVYYSEDDKNIIFCITFIFYGTLVELCEFRFLTHAFQDPLLCSSLLPFLSSSCTSPPSPFHSLPLFLFWKCCSPLTLILACFKSVPTYLRYLSFFYHKNFPRHTSWTGEEKG
jgi:hypothetical protein